MIMIECDKCGTDVEGQEDGWSLVDCRKSIVDRSRRGCLRQVERAICLLKWTEVRRKSDVTMILVLRQTLQDFADCVQVCYRQENSHIFKN